MAGDHIHADMYVVLHCPRNCLVRPSPKSVHIYVIPSNSTDVSGLAFVQALLTCGFGRNQNGFSPFECRIIWRCLAREARPHGVPWANPRLLGQIAPLLPLLQKGQFALSLQKGDRRTPSRMRAHPTQVALCRAAVFAQNVALG
jgi:hypothetical protein